MKRSMGVGLCIAGTFAIVGMLSRERGDSFAAAVLSAGGPASPAEIGALPQQDLTPLKQDIASLRAEVSALRRRLQDLAVAGPDTAETSTALRRDPATLAAAEHERQQQMAMFETRFRQESSDARWSLDAEHTVQEVVARNEALQDSLVGLECRSQTCRVELLEQDSSETMKVMPLFFQQLAQTLPSVTANYEDAGDGGRVAVLYMSREANPSPAVDK